MSGTRRQRMPARPARALELVARRGEHRGRGALEAVDRLLLVAHGKQRARLVAGAVPGEELLGQRADDVPLHRARILRLVHQDVIETAVELVEHPFDSAGRSQQARGLADQVVEVERRLPGLGSAVALHDGIAEPHERQRGIEELQLAALFVELDEALLRAREQRVDIGVGSRETSWSSATCADRRCR